MGNDGRTTKVAMEGQGFYNRNSAMQAAGIASVLQLWKDAADRVEVGDEPLTIADYGSSQGKNSMEPVAIAIDALRERVGCDRVVEVYHTDLPTNDFSTLFQALHDESGSYLAGRAGVFPCAVGRTYFEPVLPPCRVHLAWNSWTLQWLSRSPIDAPDHIFAAKSASADVVNVVRRQQAEDWKRFLHLRSGEMRPAARMLCMFAGEDEEGLSWRWLTDTLWEALCDMRSAGLISDEECHRTTVPTAPRRLADIAAPFGKSGRFEDLVVEHLELTPAPDPHWHPFQETGDRDALARSHCGMMRGFAGPTIRQALSSARNRDELVDDLFDRFTAKIAAAPRQHVHFIGVVVLAKAPK